MTTIRTNNFPPLKAVLFPVLKLVLDVCSMILGTVKFSFLYFETLYSRCGPCQVIAPKFQELSLKYTSAIFLEIDVDACKVLGLLYFCCLHFH